MKRSELAVAGGLTILLLVALTVTVPVELDDRKHSRVDKVRIASSEKAVRYIVIGDYGELDRSQTADVAMVADAMSNLTDTRPIDFIATVGDNVYPSGMIDVFDKTQFELMYEVFYKPGLTGKPWYPVLGNHDCGNPLTELQADKFYPTWNMPSSYYNFSLSLSNDTYAAFVFLNGCSIACKTLGDCGYEVTQTEIDEQYEWLESVLAEAQDAQWILVHIHMPPFSAGSDHGDNEPLKLRLYPLLAKHKVDFLLAGHDHVMQYIYAPQGSQYQEMNQNAPYDCQDFNSTPYLFFREETFMQMPRSLGLHELAIGASGHSLDQLCPNKTTSMDRLLFGSTAYGFLEMEVAVQTVTATFYSAESGQSLFTLQVVD